MSLATGASGAYAAARAGQVVLVVDVIDMSTTLEAALQAGALLVLGASPVPCGAPVPVDPRAVGRFAGEFARERGTEVVVVGEPRVGEAGEREARAAAVLAGIAAAGAACSGVFPNQGAEITRLVAVRGKVVVAVTSCGGAAFDAAFTQGVPVFTGTVARTFGRTGWENAEAALDRALAAARAEGRGLCIVAASSKALEDVLAAQYFYQRALARTGAL